MLWYGIRYKLSLYTNDLLYPIFSLEISIYLMKFLLLGVLKLMLETLVILAVSTELIQICGVIFDNSSYPKGGYAFLWINLYVA